MSHSRDLGSSQDEDNGNTSSMYDKDYNTYTCVLQYCIFLAWLLEERRCEHSLSQGAELVAINHLIGDQNKWEKKKK